MLTPMWVSCDKEETMLAVELESAPENGSTVSVKLNLSIPDPIKVTSRNGEYEAIKNITLLCFNGQGKLLSKNTYTDGSGFNAANRTLEADITYNTRVVHFIANQSEEKLSELELYSATEIAIANMEGAENAMIYWARVEVPSTVQGNQQTAAWFTEEFSGTNAITLLRNQAKVTVESADQNKFVVTGFTVVNASDKGTVAPYHSGKGAFPTIGTDFGITHWGEDADKYVRILEGTDFIDKEDVETEPQLYVYETAISDSNPVRIIFKGYNYTNDSNKKDEKYWCVYLMDEEKTTWPIRRNHYYKVVITGAMQGGYKTFDEAMVGLPANNASLYISDEYTAVSNGKFSLTVEDVNYVFATGQKENHTFGFYVEQLDKTPIDPSKITVGWYTDEEVPAQNVSNTTNLVKVLDEENSSATKKAYTLTIALNKLEDGSKGNLEGTLFINYDGVLQRKVKIQIIPMQQFGNIECIYYEKGMTNVNGAIAKLKFTIPNSYPDKMYPFNVQISTNDFNIRSTNGDGLSLIFSGDNGYITIKEDENDEIKKEHGYKYVFQVEEKNDAYYIDLISNGVVSETGTITLVSEHFEPLTIQISLMK